MTYRARAAGRLNAQAMRRERARLGRAVDDLMARVVATDAFAAAAAVAATEEYPPPFYHHGLVLTPLKDGWFIASMTWRMPGGTRPRGGRWATVSVRIKRGQGGLASVESPPETRP